MSLVKRLDRPGPDRVPIEGASARPGPDSAARPGPDSPGTDETAPDWGRRPGPPVPFARSSRRLGRPLRTGPDRATVRGQRTLYCSTGLQTLLALKEVGFAMARTYQRPGVENLNVVRARPAESTT